MAKYTNIVSGSGEIIKSNLDSKISEIYDSIYLEVESIKTKYKEIVKGIVVDEKRYNLILNNLIRAFKCLDKKELYELLDKLNSSYSADKHIKFFLERFSLSKPIYDSVDLFMSRHNLEPTNLFDDLNTISDIIRKSDTQNIYSKYKKCLNDLIMAVHKSRFENKCINKPKKKILLNDSVNGLVSINNIIESIDNIYNMHICMFDEINNFYILILNITTIINTMNKHSS